MDTKSIAKNRRAYHDYEILETFEAGIMLTGSEIKSVRAGTVSLRGSYVTLHATRGSVGMVPMLTNCHIGAYKPAQEHQHEPTRSRRLLLKASEIKKMIGILQTKGLSAIPLEIYLKGKWAKVLIGIGRGKKLHDKRQSIKERDIKKRTSQAEGRRR